MFKKVKLYHYKSFSALTFNLVHRGQIKHIVAIYDENGSGKSNLVESFQFLRESVSTMSRTKQLESLQRQFDKHNFNDVLALLEGETIEKSNFSTIARHSHRLGAEENTKLEFTFVIGGADGYYMLEYDEFGTIVTEKLRFLIQSKRGLHFELSSKEVEANYLNVSIFKS